jgi:hypothetical protein
MKKKVIVNIFCLFLMFEKSSVFLNVSNRDYLGSDELNVTETSIRNVWTSTD